MLTMPNDGSKFDENKTREAVFSLSEKRIIFWGAELCRESQDWF